MPSQKTNKENSKSDKLLPSGRGDALYRLAFENAFQGNIILDVASGNIVAANKAACTLLGYSKKELLTINRRNIFDITESSFRKMVRNREIDGSSSALVNVTKKNGRQLKCEITSAIFTDPDGVVKAITAFSDISVSILNQKNIDSRKEKIVADNIVHAKSKQKAIDVIKKKIVADNISIAKSKQKAKDVKKDRIVADNIVIAKSKQTAIDAKKDKIIAGNIRVAQAISDAVVAGFSQRLELQEKLDKEIAEGLKLIFNSSSDVLYNIDLEADEVIISNAYSKDFGYPLTSAMSPGRDWAPHIHPEDKAMVWNEFNRMLLSDEMEWKFSYRFLRSDGSVANVTSTTTILRNAAGKAIRVIGSMRDNSKEKNLEERLEQEIKLKEKQISEASADAKDTERSDIGKELHDNINQLLGASRLYLEMAKQGGAKSKVYLSRSSEYTLTAIEEIRKLTKGLATDTIKNLGLCEAIENISHDTMEVNQVKITSYLQSFQEYTVHDEFKLNLFRIVQEQLNNILKHAHATHVVIYLLQNKEEIVLTISDDGVGFDTLKKRAGIGVDNIRSRAGTYNGVADFVSEPGKSCVLTVTFPFTEAVKA